MSQTYQKNWCRLHQYLIPLGMTKGSFKNCSWNQQSAVDMEYFVKVPRVEHCPLQPHRDGEVHCSCPPFECLCRRSPALPTTGASGLNHSCESPSHFSSSSFGASPSYSSPTCQDYSQAADPSSMANMMSSAIEMHADSVFHIIDKILSVDTSSETSLSEAPSNDSKDNYELACCLSSSGYATSSCQVKSDEGQHSDNSSGYDGSQWRFPCKQAPVPEQHPDSFPISAERNKDPPKPQGQCDEDYVLTSLDDPDISQRFFAAIDNILQDYGAPESHPACQRHVPSYAPQQGSCLYEDYGPYQTASFNGRDCAVYEDRVKNEYIDIDEARTMSCYFQSECDSRGRVIVPADHCEPFGGRLSTQQRHATHCESSSYAMKQF